MEQETGNKDVVLALKTAFPSKNENAIHLKGESDLKVLASIAEAFNKDQVVDAPANLAQSLGGLKNADLSIKLKVIEAHTGLKVEIG